MLEGIHTPVSLHRWVLQKAKKGAGDDKEEDTEEATEQDEDDEKPLLAMVSKTLLAHLCMHYCLLCPMARLVQVMLFLIVQLLMRAICSDCSIPQPPQWMLATTQHIHMLQQL